MLLSEWMAHTPPEVLMKNSAVGYVPSNAPHYIENTGDTDAVFLELLATDVFEDVSLNQWLRRLPAHMVQEHLGFDKASLAKIPDEKLIIV
jgi:oxalate decarboxylase